MKINKFIIALLLLKLGNNYCSNTTETLKPTLFKVNFVNDYPNGCGLGDVTIDHNETYSKLTPKKSVLIDIKSNKLSIWKPFTNIIPTNSCYVFDVTFDFKNKPTNEPVFTIKLCELLSFSEDTKSIRSIRLNENLTLKISKRPKIINLTYKK